MNGTKLGHTRQKPSSPTLPPTPCLPAYVLPFSAEAKVAMGEPGPAEYANDTLSHIDSATSEGGFRHRGKADSVDRGDELGYQANGRAYLILRDAQHCKRFRSFLNNHKPRSATTLTQYLESQKALAAIRYANALADVVSATRPLDPQNPSQSPSVRNDAAVVGTQFQQFSRKAVDELVMEALPAYITYRMINVVTECLVKDITGTNSPFMRDLVEGLAEVYCMSDPNLPDNPLVFASEGIWDASTNSSFSIRLHSRAEFYNTTQYNHEYVIGRNCRFLQGPGTSRAAIGRVSRALRNGHEISELLLNYRRDGSPFLNLVLMDPLFDQRGNVCYHIGAQIDITRLLEGGKGLESFKQLLDQEREVSIRASVDDFSGKKPSLKMLRELGGLLSDEEADIVGQHSARLRRGSTSSTASTSARPSPMGRRFIGMDDTADENMWPPTQFGANGRLHGVYQNYLSLAPSTSAKASSTHSLRAPASLPKVSWLTHSSHPNGNDDSKPHAEPEAHIESWPRWIHCTPLLGSDSKPGVYMIVIVNKEEITSALNRRQTAIPMVCSRDFTKETWPSPRESMFGNNAARFSSAKLYADYLRREGTISDAPENIHTRRQTPKPTRAMLEEDIRMGRFNSGLARVHPRAVTPQANQVVNGNRSVAGQRPRTFQYGQFDGEHPAKKLGYAGNGESSGGERPATAPGYHRRTISMDVGAPTPHRNRSMATDLVIADGEGKEGV
ncbi:hypothetical protein BU23DRAFT_570884 [Bimuria novae-zelandiae CBS 107.79]|uniref:PAC domain-containing protein n=1 Tax=Bimuria novae-zelandiae CBS 107.79 TaxID=1447943 RepID=A0A6A5V0W0_9PLEO|nr:hypothetical protein BU23DRAFT_570884 [Bimuria novae-zelandiae CBS 107.79]